MRAGVRQEQTETKASSKPISYLMMDNEYDASFDVGVAVKEESLEAVVKSTGKKKHRVRSNNGMQRLRLGNTSSTDDEAGKYTGGELINNSGPKDDHVSAPAASAEKKSKKKRRREKSSNSNTDDGISNEGISKSSIHEAFADGLERIQKNAVLPPPLSLKGMFINERKKLPVYQHSAEIVDLISNNDVVLVVAETVRKRVSFHALIVLCHSQLLKFDPRFFLFVITKTKSGQRKINADTYLRPRKRIAENVCKGGDRFYVGIPQAKVRTDDLRDATPSRRRHHSRETRIGGDELHSRNNRGASREVRRYNRRQGAQHDENHLLHRRNAVERGDC